MGKQTNVTIGNDSTRLETYQNRFWNKIYLFFNSENTWVPTKGMHRSLRHGLLTHGDFKPQMYLVTGSEWDNEEPEGNNPWLDRTGNYRGTGKCCEGGEGWEGNTLVVKREGERCNDFHSSKVHGISLLIKDISRCFVLRKFILLATNQNNLIHILYSYCHATESCLSVSIIPLPCECPSRNWVSSF